MIVSNITATWQ